MELETLLERQDIPSEVQKLIERELSEFKKVKTRLEYLLKSGPAIIFACEPWGHYQTKFMSENVKDILGYDSEEFIDNPSFWFDRVHPDDRQRVTESFSKILDTQFFSKTYRFQRKDGSYRWMLEEDSLILDEKGNPSEIVGYWKDTTPRKEVEELLRNERENFYNILNTINDLIYIVNSDFEIEFVNSALEAEYNEGAVGSKCYEFFNNFDEMCPWCTINEVLEGETIRWEKTREQNQRTYDIIDTPLRNSDGSISLLSILRDITERKQSEEALKDSEQKFRTFIETLPQPVWIYQNYQCQYANPAAEKVTGFSTEELFSMQFWDFLHPDYKEMAIKGGKALEKGIPPPTNAIVKIITKNGDERWLDTRLELIEFEDKRATLITAMDVTERIEAEEAMRRSEERLRAFMDAATDSISIWDSKLNLIDCNNTMLELLPKRTTKDVVLGKNLGTFNLLIQADPCGTKTNDYNQFLEVLRTGESLTVELSTPYLSQFGRSLLVTAFKVGNGLGMITTDITERKQAEEALQESEEKYRNLVERANDGIAIVQDSLIKYVNPSLAKITGYSPEELYDTPIMNYIHPEYLYDVINRYEKRMAGEPVSDIYETKLILKDDKTLEIEVNAGIINYQGKPADLAIIRDITERKRAQNALKESEERLRKFMESATDGFTLFDSNLNFIDINKAGLEGLGLSKERVLGKNILDIFPSLRNTERYERYLEVIETGIPFSKDNVLFSDPRIGDKYFSVRAFKVGEGLGVISTNITARMKAEKTREELEQRRDSFVWMTSHELRTPLTVLTGYCDFLVEHLNDLAQNRITNILSVMKNNLDRLERLTNKVSTIGQIERGIFEIEKTSMNLCDFLQDTLEPYQQLLGGDQFKFYRCLKDSPIIVDGDPHRLQQVLDNIIGNAIKQTDKEQREIRVTSKISPNDIRIIVSDNGAGIEPKNLEVIFDQFVSIPTELCATGTGIGLYLCRETLEAHGGRITAKSKGPGLGATFIIELPRKIT